VRRGPIRVTDFDMQRLRKLLCETWTVPVDFVTLNTRMRIKDVGSGEVQSIQLVFSDDADPAL